MPASERPVDYANVKSVFRSTNTGNYSGYVIPNRIVSGSFVSYCEYVIRN